MSGRRVYPRFHGGGTGGTIRVCRDVTIHANADGQGLVVLSDAPVPAGEELKLLLSSGAGTLELRVKIITTEPQVVSGSLRHRLRLTVLSASPATDRRTPDDDLQ